MIKSSLHHSIALIAAFLLNTYLFFAYPSYLACALGVNAILMALVFLTFGQGAGMSLTGIAILLIFIVSIYSGSPMGYGALAFNPITSAALFLILGILLFLIKGRIASLENKLSIEVDRIHGERNLLSVSYSRSQTLNKTLQDKLDRYLSLKGITERLGPLLGMDEVANQIVDTCWRFFDGSDAVMLYLVDEERHSLKLIKERLKEESPHIKAKQGDSFDVWVLKRTQPLLVTDVGKDFRFSKEDAKTIDERRPFRALISTPLVSHHKTVGILRAESALRDYYNVDDLRLLNIVADLSAVSLFNSSLYQHTQRLATIDGLTGLYLRRYFDQRLEEEIKMAIERGLRFSILMIDIDDFKRYNDTFGHIAGDLVLRSIAQMLKVFVEGKGFLTARYGGEEFVALILGGSKEASIIFANELRLSVEKQTFYLRREKTNVTVSIGLAYFPEDTKRKSDSAHIKKEDIINIADERLYEAKRRGKNRVCG